MLKKKEKILSKLLLYNFINIVCACSLASVISDKLCIQRFYVSAFAIKYLKVEQLLSFIKF